MRPGGVRRRGPRPSTGRPRPGRPAPRAARPAAAPAGPGRAGRPPRRAARTTRPARARRRPSAAAARRPRAARRGRPASAIRTSPARRSLVRERPVQRGCAARRGRRPAGRAACPTRTASRRQPRRDRRGVPCSSAASTPASRASPVRAQHVQSAPDTSATTAVAPGTRRQPDRGRRQRGGVGRARRTARPTARPPGRARSATTGACIQCVSVCTCPAPHPLGDPRRRTPSRAKPSTVRTT